MCDVRKDMIVPELKWYEIENSSGCGNLLKKHFTKLENDVVISTVVDENLGHATVSNDYLFASQVLPL